MRFIVREYVAANGSCPFRAWLDRLDLPTRARIQARVLRLELGLVGDERFVGQGAWEARLHFGPGYRLYFGKAAGSVIVLLLGGSKATQARDIGRARRFWADYSGGSHG